MDARKREATQLDRETKIKAIRDEWRKLLRANGFTESEITELIPEEAQKEGIKC